MIANIPYPVIDMEKTGQNIRKLREERNISKIDVQCFLGTSLQAVYQYEQGFTLPRVDNLLALSHLFNVTMNDIIVLKEPSCNNYYYNMDHKISDIRKFSNNSRTILMAA